MASTLSKGDTVSIAKLDPSLKNVKIGLGWDARSTDGQDIDLVASAFPITDTRKVGNANDFIFYNNLKSSDGSDAESLVIALDRVPQEVIKIVFVVMIHDALERHQSFDQITNAFIRLENNDRNVEVVRYDLPVVTSNETTMLFGEMYRQGGEWQFRAVGRGCVGWPTATGFTLISW